MLEHYVLEMTHTFTATLKHTPICLLFDHNVFRFAPSQTTLSKTIYYIYIIPGVVW